MRTAATSSRSVTRSSTPGADVIFGHGPHIMRGMEFYKGRLIAYSLGNFCGYRVLSYGWLPRRRRRAEGDAEEGRHLGAVARSWPPRWSNGGIAVPDTDLRALAFVNGLSKDDFGANAAVISTTDGAISPPV